METSGGRPGAIYEWQDFNQFSFSLAVALGLLPADAQYWKEAPLFAAETPISAATARIAAILGAFGFLEVSEDRRLRWKEPHWGP